MYMKRLFILQMTEVVDGNKRYYILSNGIKHGPYIEWYDNNQTKIHCCYDNGRKHGNCRIWNQYGQLLCNFLIGIKHGLYVEWHDSGQLKIRCCYINNRKHGNYSMWNQHGQLIIKGEYYIGIRHGSHQLWHNNGKLHKS